MRILAFDTGADLCSVVLVENGQLRAERTLQTERDQASVLAPLTQELLNECDITAHDIDGFAIASGPGSFTGLRVGLAFVRGLSLATKKPVGGFDHFRCTRLAIKTDAIVLVVRESKRAELFACLFDAQSNAATPFLATPQQLVDSLAENVMLAGNGTRHLVALKPELAARVLDIPLNACALSAARLAAEIPVAQWPAAQPIYLRDADVSFPKSA